MKIYGYMNVSQNNLSAYLSDGWEIYTPELLHGKYHQLIKYRHEVIN